MQKSKSCADLSRRVEQLEKMLFYTNRRLMNVERCINRRNKYNNIDLTNNSIKKDK